VVRVSSVLGELGVSLLQVGELHSGALGEGEDGLLAESDDENVAESGGEVLASGVSHVSNVEGAGMLLDVGEDADSADGVSLGDVDISSLLELQDGVDLSGVEVEL